MLITFLKVSMILVAFVSCSGVLFKNQVPSTQVDINKYSSIKEKIVINEEHQVEQAKEQLKSLVQEAHKMGEEAISYLSDDLFVKATDASLREDSELAAFLFSFVHELKPNDYYIMRQYAIELLKLGQFEKAKNLLELSYTQDLNDSQQGLILAGVYTALEHKDKAKEIYERLLTKDKQNHQACIFLSKSYALDKEYPKAIKLLNQCRKNSPNMAIYPYYIGKLQLEAGNDQLSKKAFLDSIKIDPSYVQSIINLGLIYEEEGKYKDALALYESYLKDQSLNAMVLSRVVNILFVTKQSEKTIPYLKKLVEMDPDDLNLMVRLGIIYSEMKDYQKAKETFEKILTKVPSSDNTLYSLGALNKQIGNLEESLDYFMKVSASSEYYEDSNLQIAFLLKKLALEHSEASKREEFENRLLTFIDGLTVKSTGFKLEMAVLKASYFETVNRLKEAIIALNDVKALEGYGNDHDYYLASLYEKNNQVDKSINLVRLILKTEPNNAHALNFLGYTLLEQGKDLDEAYKLIKKAVELGPSDGYIRDSLGWYYYKTGNLQKAVKELEMAHSLVKDELTIIKHLAIVYRDLKKIELSKKFFMEALEKTKITQEKEEIQKELENIEKIRLPASHSPDKNPME